MNNIKYRDFDVFWSLDFDEKEIEIKCKKTKKQYFVLEYYIKEADKIDDIYKVVHETAEGIVDEWYENYKDEDLYRIKSLEWDNIGSGHFVTNTIFGKMHIIHNGYCWKWKYVFDEYYEENQGTFRSFDKCRKHLEDIYKTRIKEGLEEVG